MSGRLADVTIVPDFSGETALLFEARSLFFLASWLERGDPATPVRLCCIGEAPPSVRRLAANAGAAIERMAPVAGFWGGFANKLRGLEKLEPGDRRLLLDADVLVVGSLDLIEQTTADFAAAVAGKPQVPQERWKEIYALLELPLPETRVASVRGRLGLDKTGVEFAYEQQEAEAMLPYFNSGVLLARGGCGLRERWEECMRRILRFATGNPAFETLHAVMFGDQVGLAAALHALQLEGRTFSVLPEACNARAVHLREGAMPWREVRLLHAAGFLRTLRARSDLPAILEAEAHRWGSDAGAFLTALWERWVQPAW